MFRFHRISSRLLLMLLFLSNLAHSSCPTDAEGLADMDVVLGTQYNGAITYQVLTPAASFSKLGARGLAESDLEPLQNTITISCRWTLSNKFTFLLDEADSFGNLRTDTGGVPLRLLRESQVSNGFSYSIGNQGAYSGAFQKQPAAQTGSLFLTRDTGDVHLVGGIAFAQLDAGAEEFAFNIPLLVIFHELEDLEIKKNLLLLVNASVLPQVAFGTSGPLTVVSQVVVSNPTPGAVEEELEFFDPSDGSEKPVRLRVQTAAAAPQTPGEAKAEHDFVVPGDSTLVLEVLPATDDGPVQTAWAFVYGTRDLKASILFSTFSSGEGTSPNPLPSCFTCADLGELIGEAGIAATGVATRQFLAVQKTAGGVNTSFAVTHPTSATANIRLSLLDSENQGVAEGQLVLEPHTQVARFFDEFFELDAESFSGTVKFLSDTALSVMSVRTLGGIQTASLPSGSLD